MHARAVGPIKGVRAMKPTTKGNKKMTNTDKILADMIAHAKAGNEVIPMFFQPARGISNSVSAAVRKGKKLGILVEGGKDGCGKPFYVLPTPKATHTGTATLN